MCDPFMHFYEVMMMRWHGGAIALKAQCMALGIESMDSLKAQCMAMELSQWPFVDLQITLVSAMM